MRTCHNSTAPIDDKKLCVKKFRPQVRNFLPGFGLRNSGRGHQVQNHCICCNMKHMLSYGLWRSTCIFKKPTCSQPVYLAQRGLTWHGTIKKLSGAGMAMPCPFGRGFAGIAYGKAHGTNKKRSGLKKCQASPLCASLQHDHMWPHEA